MMRKLLQTTSALALACLMIIPASCEKDDNTRCSAEARTVSDAGVLYASTQTTQNCLLYKTAIMEYLNSPCSSGLSSSDRLQLQNILKNLPC